MRLLGVLATGHLEVEAGRKRVEALEFFVQFVAMIFLICCHFNFFVINNVNKINTSSL